MRTRKADNDAILVTLDRMGMGMGAKWVARALCQPTHTVTERLVRLQRRGFVRRVGQLWYLRTLGWARIQRRRR